MMLKSFGFDPEKIKQQFQETAAQVMAKVDNIDARLARIEAKLDAGGNMDSMNHVENESQQGTDYAQLAGPQPAEQGAIDA